MSSEKWRPFCLSVYVLISTPEAPPLALQMGHFLTFRFWCCFSAGPLGALAWTQVLTWPPAGQNTKLMHFIVGRLSGSYVGDNG